MRGSHKNENISSGPLEKLSRNYLFTTLVVTKKIDDWEVEMRTLIVILLIVNNI